MMTSSELQARLPEGLVVKARDPSWLVIENPDGTHVGIVLPDKGILCFDVDLHSVRREDMSSDEVEDLRERYEEAVTDTVLPTWAAQGFGLDTVEECAASGSDWWHIVARLEGQWKTPEQLDEQLAFARANADEFSGGIWVL